MAENNNIPQNDGDKKLSPSEKEKWILLSKEQLSNEILDSLTVNINGINKFIKDIIYFPEEINKINSNQEENIKLQIFLSKKLNKKIELNGYYNQQVLNLINEYKAKFPKSSDKIPNTSHIKEFNTWKDVPTNFSGKVKIIFNIPSYLECTLKDGKIDETIPGKYVNSNNKYFKGNFKRENGTTTYITEGIYKGQTLSQLDNVGKTPTNTPSATPNQTTFTSWAEVNKTKPSGEIIIKFTTPSYLKCTVTNGKIDEAIPGKYMTPFGILLKGTFKRENEMTIFNEEGPIKGKTLDDIDKIQFFDENTSVASDFNGLAIEKYEDGNYYIGNYKNGKKHGKGKKVFEDGSSYTGNFKDGNFIDGTYITTKNIKFTGSFRVLPNGEILYIKKGSIYNGKTISQLDTYTSFDDENNVIPIDFYGLAQMKWKDGTSYVGDFLSGKPDGKGIYTNIHNIDFRGNFINSNDKEIGTMFITDEAGNYIGKTLEQLDGINKNPVAEAPAAAPSPIATAPAPQEQTGTNSIKINQAWAKNQILTYKENFDYEKPTKQDIIDILGKYKDADFSKKENIPENSALVIYAIQLAIKELGYANDLGNIDGIFGQKTIEALKKLQEEKLGFTGKDIDGIPGPKTIQVIIEKLNAQA